MRNGLKFSLLNLFLVVVAFMVAPIVRADGWDKETVVTFTEPVEVPGQVLPAGTYVFKLAENPTDRLIVQIFTADQQKLLTTILAIPDYRSDRTDKPVFSFDERPLGEPEAVRTWFYPGDEYGVEFVYPKSTTQLAVNSEPIAPEAPAAETAPPPSSGEVVAQEEQQKIVTEETPAQPVNAVPETLPKTAGNFLALPLVGFVLLCGGSTMLRKLQQRT